MSRSNWSIIATLIGLATVYWLVGDLASVSRQIQSEATDRSHEYGKDADSYVERRCEGLAATASEDCTRQTDQAARENQRVELDIAAQRMTAWWTQVMGVAALMGMALSAIGVWLVWTTFRETKAANEIAKEGQRAWLYIESIEARQYGVIVTGKLQIFTNVTLRIKNSGLSSAVNVDRRVKGIATNKFREELQETFFTESVGRYYNTVENVAPGASIELIFMVDRHEMVDLRTRDGTDTLTTISISLGYSDRSPIRHQTGQSYFTCKAILEADGTQAFPIEDLTVPLVTVGKPMGRPCALRPVPGAVMT